MRLKEGIKLSFHQKQSKSVFLFLFFFLFTMVISLNARSQEFHFNYTDTPASTALTDIASKLGIKIAFDAGELRKIIISKTIKERTPERILSAVLEGTGFLYRFEYGSFLIIRDKEVSSPLPGHKNFVTGIVCDKETGERLPYPNVLLVDENKYIFSSVEGAFSFLPKDSGSVDLQVSYLGYQDFDQTINVQESSPVFIWLSKNVHTIETVKVTGGWTEMASFTGQAGHFVYNPSRFSDLPNFGETDIFRSLQLLPGISSSENSADLNIRGSSADQNLVMYDGFTLYNLDHFFGEFSALNPNVIKDIQVFRGGFDSRYGERVSGIVDITGKSGNQYKPAFSGGINLISGTLTAEIPVSEKFTVVAGGRRAYSDIYSTFLTEALLNNRLSRNLTNTGQNINAIKPDFYFSDYNLKITWRPNSGENIFFSLYGAKDFLDNSNYFEKNQLGIDTKDINKWGNYGFGLSWRKQWKGAFYSDFQIGHSGYYNDYYNKTFLRNKPNGQPGQGNAQDADSIRITNENNKLEDYFLSARSFYSINPLNQFEFGLSTRINRYSYYKDADTPLIYNDMESSAALTTLFFQDKINLNQKWNIKPGIRISLYGKTGKFYFEPRFSTSWAPGNGFVLKMATGRYYQYLNKLESEQTYGYNRNFWVLADDQKHPVVSSNHFILGGSYERNHFFFEMEGYYKTIHGIEEYLFFTPDQRKNNSTGGTTGNTLYKFITGKGKAVGLDFLAKYESSRYIGWLAYSISKSVRNFNAINNNADIPAPFDKTHEFKWINILPLKNWNFSTQLIYSTGRPYFKSSLKDQNFITTRVYDRLPDYFRTDLSVNYNLTLKKVFLKPGFSVINLFNTQNYYDIYSREIEFQKNTTLQTTLVKAQELTFNFFINFKF
jgi:ferric enterobactin receptor